MKVEDGRSERGWRKWELWRLALDGRLMRMIVVKVEISNSKFNLTE